jgi:peptide deformylase
VSNFKVIEKEHTPRLSEMDNPKQWIKDNKSLLDNFLGYVSSIENAAGMASNQVSLDGNRLEDRFAVVKHSDEFAIAVDPKITKFHGEKAVKFEGCLTWGDKKIIIAERYQKIDVEYYDVNGNIQKETLTDEAAQIFQHEVDHLEGINEYVIDNGPKEPYKRPNKKVGRNEPCPCGSSIKYKKCCMP